MMILPWSTVSLTAPRALKIDLVALICQMVSQLPNGHSDTLHLAFIVWTALVRDLSICANSHHVIEVVQVTKLCLVECLRNPLLNIRFFLFKEQDILL